MTDVSVCLVPPQTLRARAQNWEGAPVSLCAQEAVRPAWNRLPRHPGAPDGCLASSVCRKRNPPRCLTPRAGCAGGGGPWPCPLGPRDPLVLGAQAPLAAAGCWLLAAGCSRPPRSGARPAAAVAQPWLMCDWGEGWPGLAPPAGPQTPVQQQGLKEPRWNKAQAAEKSGFGKTPAQACSRWFLGIWSSATQAGGGAGPPARLLE